MDGRVEVRVHRQNVRRDHRDGEKDNAHVPAELGIFEREVELLLQQEEVDREVHAEQRHEDRCDRLQIRAVACERVCLDGKAARTGRCKRVAERVKKRHAASQVKYHLYERERKVDRIQDFRRVDHSRDHLADRRPRALGTQEMDALPAFHFDDGQHEYQNAHAAQPVRKAPPEEHAAAERLDVRQDARARRCKAGDHLEHRVQVKRNFARERKRQRTN